MKKLSEYPTPDTDFIFAGWLKSHPARLSHAKIEQRLAACRKALKIIADGQGVDYLRIEQLADETLTLTAPK